MIKPTTITTTVFALLFAGCVARTGFGVSGGTASGSGPTASPAPDVGASYGPGEDEHWFTADDYLVSPDAYEDKKLTVHVAKMVAIATGSTKAEARFLRANGEELWTATYFATRIATPDDLRVGALAFCSAGYWERTAEAPKDKYDARQNEWIVAAITDTADLYKGRVTVGGASCSIHAVRVPVQ